MPPKRNASGDTFVILTKTPTKRQKLQTQTNYALCIICQKKCGKLYHIVSCINLKTAMDRRKDDVAQRLLPDMADEQWLDTNHPKWHVSCRKSYTKQKVYQQAANRNTREAAKEVSQSSLLTEPSVHTTATDRPSTRCLHDESVFDPTNMCFICGHKRFQNKYPESKITIPDIEEKLLQHARSTQRYDVEDRMGYGRGFDMVSNDMCYHRVCMNRFRAACAPKPLASATTTTVHDAAFQKLLTHDIIQDAVLVKKLAVSMKDVTNIYNDILHEMDDQVECYRVDRLESKLTKHFENRISLLPRSTGPAFLTSSGIKIGDAIAKLHKLQGIVNDKSKMAYSVSKDLRQKCMQRKADYNEQEIEISHEWSYKMVPNDLFNFCCGLIDSKVTEPPIGQEKIQVDKQLEEKAVLLSQIIIQYITPMNTPLAVGSAYHQYNKTRSKSLINMNNKLHIGISYDTLHRQLTKKCEDIIMKIEEHGVYIPENITANTIYPPIFAVDNLDWFKKTLEGGSFNATTSMIIQNVDNVEPSKLLVGGSTRKRTLSGVSNPCPPSQVYVSTADRRKSKSLQQIPSLAALSTASDDTAADLLLLWKLGRLVTLRVGELDDVNNMPDFNVLCDRIGEEKPASQLGYLPIVPSSPTNASVLKGVMINIVKTNKALGHDWTIIAGDQATYELAAAIRQKDETLNKVVLMLGGFHLAYNYLKAMCKIVRDAGGENLLVMAGLFSEGTAKKTFGEKAQYYQALYAVDVLSEALHSLYMEAFDEQVSDSVCTWKKDLEQVIRQMKDNNVTCDNVHNVLHGAHVHLEDLRSELRIYNDTLKAKPTAILWLTFLQMVDNLHRFLFYERERNWEGYLSEAAKMLPFLAAAGHHKYAQESLPLYLKEMKDLPARSPIVHAALVAGAFVGRRSDGTHNSVSPDMILEQSYNADAKEESGLDAIMTNESARTKWVYTKAITSAVSAQFKDMLHLLTHDTVSHEAKGNKRRLMVQNVVASLESNPFKLETTNLINISTGITADNDVQVDLTSVEDIGTKAMEKSISNQEKTIVRLHTFFTQNEKKKTKPCASKPTTEVTALLRMTQIVASGGDLDVIDVVGKHECSEYPPSMFTAQGTMYNPGTKSSLVKDIMKGCDAAIKDQDGAVGEVINTAVVVDAMHAIRKWSFQKGDKYEDIANSFKKKLLRDVPKGTTSIHFCCDRYLETSLKEGERIHRAAKNKQQRTYEVRDGFKAPDPTEFFNVSANKARLLRYLCDKWANEPIVEGITLYLAGGFQDVDVTVRVTNIDAILVPDLCSTHEEADQRIMLHLIYISQNDQIERTVVHCNDTDVICLALYYSHVKELENLWIRTEYDKYIDVCVVANHIGNECCRMLPFIHSIGGRDTTSFLYNIGKGQWLKHANKLQFPALSIIGEQREHNVTQDMMDEAKVLLKSVYGKTSGTIAEMRAQKFLNSKSMVIKTLPPTEAAFEEHVKRAAFATITDKTSHISKPNLPDAKAFGWKELSGVMVPVSCQSPKWPSRMDQRLSCGCNTGCMTHCRCKKRGVPCYVACKCLGSTTKCAHTRALATLQDT